MSNQAFYIPSEYDKEENKWYNERYFGLAREIKKKKWYNKKLCSN